MKLKEYFLEKSLFRFRWNNKNILPNNTAEPLLFHLFTSAKLSKDLGFSKKITQSLFIHDCCEFLFGDIAVDRIINLRKDFLNIILTEIQKSNSNTIEEKNFNDILNILIKSTEKQTSIKDELLNIVNLEQYEKLIACLLNYKIIDSKSLVMQDIVLEQKRNHDLMGDNNFIELVLSGIDTSKEIPDKIFDFLESVLEMESPLIGLIEKIDTSITILHSEKTNLGLEILKNSNAKDLANYYLKHLNKIRLEDLSKDEINKVSNIVFCAIDMLNKKMIEYNKETFDCNELPDFILKTKKDKNIEEIFYNFVEQKKNLSVSREEMMSEARQFLNIYIPDLKINQKTLSKKQISPIENMEKFLKKIKEKQEKKKDKKLFTEISKSTPITSLNTSLNKDLNLMFFISDINSKYKKEIEKGAKNIIMAKNILKLREKEMQKKKTINHLKHINKENLQLNTQLLFR